MCKSVFTPSLTPAEESDLEIELSDPQEVVGFERLRATVSRDENVVLLCQQTVFLVPY